ncbi:MAG: hypothetical protein P1U41_08045 [Vicingaceae bacterium]|nr:hypothetical protein [Vicingaceae bacterium]
MLHAHSGFRWLVLLFLVLAAFKALAGWLGKKPYGKTDNLLAILLVSFTHIQLIIGAVLYFMSDITKTGMANMGNAMKEPTLRFWTVEHAVIMILAVAFITIGRAKSKKAKTDELKHKKGAIFYLLALLLIVWGGIIKPYAMGRGWF